MCIVAPLAAAAGAAGAASTLATLGTAVAAAGSIWQGVATSRAASAQARGLARQAADERQLNAVKDERTRGQFRTEIRQQMAELAGRGVQLDSPTAILMGQVAAQEMAFQSQAIRSEGAARQTELSAAERIARGQSRQAMIGGMLNAASGVLTSAPKIWPELLK